MLLIFGTRVIDAIINVVVFVCGVCGQEAPQNVIKRSNRVTLFFIPLFSVSTRYLNQCTNCGALTSLTRQQADNSVAWSRTVGRSDDH